MNPCVSTGRCSSSSPRSFRDEYGGEMCRRTSRTMKRGDRRRQARLCSLRRAIADARKRRPRARRTSSGRISLRRAVSAAHARLRIHRHRRRRARHRRDNRAFSSPTRPGSRPAVRRNPDRWSRSGQDPVSRGNSRLEPSPPNFLDWKRQATVLRTARGIFLIARAATASLGSGERHAWLAAGHRRQIHFCLAVRPRSAAPSRIRLAAAQDDPTIVYQLPVVANHLCCRAPNTRPANDARRCTGS